MEKANHHEMDPKEATKHLKIAAGILQLKALRLFEVAVDMKMDTNTIESLANLSEDLDPMNFPFPGFKPDVEPCLKAVDAGIVDVYDYVLLGGMVDEWREIRRIDKTRRAGD